MARKSEPSGSGDPVPVPRSEVRIIRHRERGGPVRVLDRLFLRFVRAPSGVVSDRSRRAEQTIWLRELERVGRLIAAGPAKSPPGHVLVLRAANRSEAERVLRSDPFVDPDGPPPELWDWMPDRVSPGVNLVPPPARGAGRLTDLHRISIFVRDQTAAARWYEEVLGLAVRSQDPETEMLELSLGPGAAGLALVRPRPEWGEPHFSITSQRVGQGTGISFRTDSVEALALRLQHAGARVTQPPRPEPWGGRSIRFADPDGNEFLAFDAGPARAETVARPARRRHRRRTDLGDAAAL